MKTKKHQLKSTLSILALALAVSGNLASPWAEQENSYPSFQPPAIQKDEIPERDDKVQPLSDMDRSKTHFETNEQ